MRRYVPFTILLTLLSFVPVPVPAETGVPGWEKEFPHEIAHVSHSDDFKKVAVAQLNEVQLYDSRGNEIFEIATPSPPIPLLSPDGHYLMIQVRGGNDFVRKVYLYTTGGLLRWSRADLPRVAFFSRSGRYILFSSWIKGGAVLMDVKGNVIWEKGPDQIGPDLHSVFLSRNADTIVFNQEGIFRKTGERVKDIDFGWFCDMSADGTLIVNHAIIDNQVFLNLFDAGGNRIFSRPIVTDAEQNPEAALALSLSRENATIALAGNQRGPGSLRVFDLEGHERWTRGDLPKFIPVDMSAVTVEKRYIRLNTFEDIRVYDLRGNLTWKSSGTEFDYFMSGNERYVLVKAPRKLYYLGPSDYLGLEKAAENVTGPTAPPPGSIPMLPPIESVSGPEQPRAATAIVVPKGITLHDKPIEIPWKAILIVLLVIAFLFGIVYGISRRNGTKKKKDYPDDWKSLMRPWENDR